MVIEVIEEEVGKEGPQQWLSRWFEKQREEITARWNEVYRRMQQKTSTRGTMEDYTEGQHEEIWVHKMMKWECTKMELLDTERLNVLY